MHDFSSFASEDTIEIFDGRNAMIAVSITYQGAKKSVRFYIKKINFMIPLLNS
jgi:hypothetical protein